MAALPPEYYFTTLFITVIIIILSSRFFRQRRRSEGEELPLPPPPGPWKLPVIGNLHQLICEQPHHRLRDLAHKHGPNVLGLQLGELPYVVISSPEAAREVMKAHDLSFASRQPLLASEIVFYGARDIALAPYGAYWRQMRKICVVELLSAARVLTFREIRESEVSNLVAAVSAAAGGVVDVGRLVAAGFGRLTFRAAFGMAAPPASKEATFSRLIAHIWETVGTFSVSDLFPSVGFLPALTGFRSRLNRLHLEVDALLEEIINEHKSRRRNGRPTGTSSEDLVDILLNLQEDDGSGQLDFPLTTEAIKAVILDMFLGGIETTATTVEWTMSELMRNPDVMRKAQQEVRQMLDYGGGEEKNNNVSEEGLQNLTYLDLVIQESLRLHPALPLLFPREARERAEVQGYEIRSGTKVIVNAWAIGRDSRYWTETANEFVPERFLARPTDYRGNDFTYIPFGSGRRMCPGISFGMVAVKLTLANLLYSFDWQLPDGTSPENLDMTEHFGASVRRKHSLCLIPVAHT